LGWIGKVNASRSLYHAFAKPKAWHPASHVGGSEKIKGPAVD
jgi:hypothetical protein